MSRNLLCLFILAFAGPGCAEKAPKDSASPESIESTDGTTLARTRDSRAASAQVVFETPKGEIRIAVEVVTTREEITRGLMHRRSMPWSRGMLFVMPRTEVQSFWMKNTYIPLDMMFIREDRSVAGIVERTEPLTRKSRRIEEPTRYVLEVNAGWSSENGIKAGAVAKFINVKL